MLQYTPARVRQHLNVPAFYGPPMLQYTPARVRQLRFVTSKLLVKQVTIHTRKGIDAGGCFGMGLHCPKSGAPASAFYNHSKKTPVRVRKPLKMFLIPFLISGYNIHP